MIGRTVSHYKILEKIGEGGMGVVFRAEDLKLKRQAALKFLAPKIVVSEELKNRLVLEAQAAAALDHPNICTIYEIGEHEGQTFIAMSLVSGSSLKEIVATGPLALSEALDIAVQVAQGLEQAHAKGIIHRDIKPANVMITDRGQVKIMDFGLARFGGDADVTQTVGISGTVAAMSPEQAQGEPVDSRTDIWSLGILLFEMLTGKHPFYREHPQAMVYAILREDPEPMSRVKSGIPPEIESIVLKCLQKDATARYAAMGELLEDLRAVQTGRTVSVVESANIVAVIDFANITRDPESDWLVGGIAETVTVDLKKIAVLNVLSREKVLRAMGRKSVSTITERDIIDIGQSLKARWIVWGGYPHYRSFHRSLHGEDGRIGQSRRPDGGYLQPSGPDYHLPHGNNEPRPSRTRV
jgi:serine/threonine protein kinase